MDMYIGESFVGSGPNAAHINVVLGPRSGPVGTAWANALSSPSAGHLPYMVVLQPGIPVKPATVFVNKAALSGERHEMMTWGPAQAGVAKGIQECLLEGVLPVDAEDGWCVIAAVWVDPKADQADEVFANNYRAAKDAVTNALALLPRLSEVREAVRDVHNPFYTPKGY
ncbi:formaldehyde-activating enzyme [Allomeiothermus silvanus]|uniref:formaldehyde-activating enzyme n=1 Tax=Allomeiothermus silvanus TaxID=52022 RepID=UPI0023EF5D53|nr:formaldehyde-activating enzyme [Allomeiothermus silvanus]